MRPDDSDSLSRHDSALRSRVRTSKTYPTGGFCDILVQVVETQIRVSFRHEKPETKAETWPIVEVRNGIRRGARCHRSRAHSASCRGLRRDPPRDVDALVGYQAEVITAPSPIQPAATFRHFFEQLASCERYTDSAKDESRPVGSGEELYSYIQAQVSAVSMRQILEGTPGYDAFRTLVFRKLTMPLTASSQPRIDAALLNDNPELTAAGLDGLALGQVIELWTGNAKRKPLTGSKRKGGRKAINPKLDRRVWNAWQTGFHSDYAGLASELGLKKEEVESAMDRERKWQSKEASENTVKPG